MCVGERERAWRTSRHALYFDLENETNKEKNIMKKLSIFANIYNMRDADGSNNIWACIPPGYWRCNNWVLRMKWTDHPYQPSLSNDVKTVVLNLD